MRCPLLALVLVARSHAAPPPPPPWTLETLDCYSAYYNEWTLTQSGQDCQPSSAWFGWKTDAECISYCKSNRYAFAIVASDNCKCALSTGCSHTFTPIDGFKRCR